MRISDDNVSTYKKVAIVSSTGALTGWGMELLRQQNLKRIDKADKFIGNVLSNKLKEKYILIKSGYSSEATEELKASARRTARKLRLTSAVAGAMFFGAIYIGFKYADKFLNKLMSPSKEHVTAPEVVDSPSKKVASNDKDVPYDYDEDFNDDPINEVEPK